jgi:hypothetical protein
MRSRHYVCYQSESRMMIQVKINDCMKISGDFMNAVNKKMKAMTTPTVEVASIVESCKVPEGSLEMEGKTNSTPHVMIRNLKTLHNRKLNFIW